MAVIRDSMQNKVYQATKQYGSYIQLFHNQLVRQKAVDRLEEGKHIINLSTGFNLRDSSPVLVNQVARDSLNPFLYRNYEPPPGHPIWIHSVLAYENIRSRFGYRLTSKNVVVAAGSCVTFHYIARFLKETYPDCDVVAPITTYAGFGENMAPFEIPVIEIVSDESPGLLPTVNEIREGITSRSKLIYTGPVNNPTGIILDNKEARDLLALAKEHSLYLMWDETQSTLAPHQSRLPDMWAIAEELDAWDNLIIISSLSKDRGIPGYRIAWVVGPEQVVERFAEYNSNLYSMPATLFTGLVMKDLLFRSIGLLCDRGITKVEAFERFMMLVLEPLELTEPTHPRVEYRFHQFLIPGLKEFLSGFYPIEKILRESQEFAEWMTDGQKLFKDNFDLVKEVFNLPPTYLFDSMAGFNCFVPIPQLDGVEEQQIFVQKMLIDAGIEILPGPAFGLQPKHWEQQLGFWTRITLSSSRKVLVEGLDRLMAYVRSYTGIK